MRNVFSRPTFWTVGPWLLALLVALLRCLVALVLALFGCLMVLFAGTVWRLWNFRRWIPLGGRMPLEVGFDNL